jgi:hypothetical protein
MIKEGLESLGWFIFGLTIIILISILHTVGLIEADDEYGF